MTRIDLETLLKLVWSLGSSKAGDPGEIAPDREEKDTLIRDVEAWMEERVQRSCRARRDSPNDAKRANQIQTAGGVV